MRIVELGAGLSPLQPHLLWQPQLVKVEMETIMLCALAIGPPCVSVHVCLILLH